MRTEVGRSFTYKTGKKKPGLFQNVFKHFNNKEYLLEIFDN